MKKIIATAAVVAMFGAFGSAVAGDAAAGKGKYAVCMGCHGATGAGNPAAGYPALAGQSADAIATKIKGYQSGAINNATMKAMTAGLSADDVANVSAYIATMK